MHLQALKDQLRSPQARAEQSVAKVPSSRRLLQEGRPLLHVAVLPAAPLTLPANVYFPLRGAG